MGGATVQTNPVAKYEKTKDPRRMLTHKLLDEAIRKDWENVRGFLPARTATYLEYQAGATKAQAWNEGEQKVTIDLPLQNGWYIPDGNPFALPNGRSSNHDDPDALYLFRHQDQSCSGPVSRDVYDFSDVRRYVFAFDVRSLDSGVALVGRSAAAPLVAVSAEELAEVTDPKTLVQRAEQLEAMAQDFGQRFGDKCTPEMHQRFVTEPLETAKMLRELAGKIETARS